MPAATITSKGQITIPIAIRRAMHLESGDRLEFRVRADGIAELIPANQDVRALFGILKPKVRGVTVEQMNEAIRLRGSRS